MKICTCFNRNVCRHKVVFNRWVDLDNVATAASNVVVHNSSRFRHVVWSLMHQEGVRAVLKSSCKLRRVHLKLQDSGLEPEVDKIGLRIIRKDWRTSCLETRAAALTWIWIIEAGINEKRIPIFLFSLLLCQLASVAGLGVRCEIRCGDVVPNA